MLTDEKVIKYVKDNLGYPFTEIELLDEEILFRCKEFALGVFFSEYVPVYKFYGLDTSDENVQTTNPNRFKIPDDDGAQIMEIRECIPNFTGWSFLGMANFVGTLSYSSLPNWYLEMADARTAWLTSPYYTTHEFVHPCYVEIRPNISATNCKWLIAYDAQHIEFTTVPAYRERHCLDLCQGYIKKNIAEIRRKYREIRTTFGNIELNWDEIMNDGKEIYDRTIEDLKKIPPLDRIFIG